MRSPKVIAALTVANLLLMIGVWVGALGGTGEAGPPDPDVARARELQLVNAEGQVVGQLYSGDDGSGLVLFDGRPDPAPGVTASAGPQRSRVVLSDADGGRRVLRP